MGMPSTHTHIHTHHTHTVALTEVVELEPILEDMDLKAQLSVINRNKVARTTKMVLGPDNKPLSKWGLDDEHEDGDASGPKKRCVWVWGWGGGGVGVGVRVGVGGWVGGCMCVCVCVCVLTMFTTASALVKVHVFVVHCCKGQAFFSYKYNGQESDNQC